MGDADDSADDAPAKPQRIILSKAVLERCLDLVRATLWLCVVLVLVRLFFCVFVYFPCPLQTSAIVDLLLNAATANAPTGVEPAWALLHASAALKVFASASAQLVAPHMMTLVTYLKGHEALSTAPAQVEFKCNVAGVLALCVPVAPKVRQQTLQVRRLFFVCLFG